MTTIGSKHRIAYVTSSKHKVEEIQVLLEKGRLTSGNPISSIIKIDIRQVNIKETLEVDLQAMVKAEVAKAYSEIKVPCIVEHAGLVFVELEDKSYPGGLTKPMWNALGRNFVDETHSAGRQAIARAVVGYCDGMRIDTFVGETIGQIAEAPRGSRDFYWDVIFIPREAKDSAKGRTYAEIVDDPTLGLEYKVLKLSQSTRAMLKLFDFLQETGRPKLWPGR